MPIAAAVLLIASAQLVRAPVASAEPASASEPESEAEAESEPESESESESESGPEAEAESEVEAEVESESESESETDRLEPRPLGARGPVVHIEVRGPMAVRLHQLGPGAAGEIDGSVRGMPFSTVCHSPCDQAVEVRDRMFLVAAPEVMPSPEFTLDEYDHAVTLHVTPGLRSVRFAGFGVTVAGAVLVPLGVLVLAAAGNRSGGTAAGGTLIGVGGVSLATGIGLLLVGRTRVVVEGS